MDKGFLFVMPQKCEKLPFGCISSLLHVKRTDAFIHFPVEECQN